MVFLRSSNVQPHQKGNTGNLLKEGIVLGVSFQCSACPGATCLTHFDNSILALNSQMNLEINVSQVWASGVRGGNSGV